MDLTFKMTLLAGASKFQVLTYVKTYLFILTINDLLLFHNIYMSIKSTDNYIKVVFAWYYLLETNIYKVLCALFYHPFDIHGLRHFTVGQIASDVNFLHSLQS